MALYVSTGRREGGNTGTVTQRRYKKLSKASRQTHLCLDLGETWELPPRRQDRGPLQAGTAGHIPLGSGSDQEEEPSLPPVSTAQDQPHP